MPSGVLEVPIVPNMRGHAKSAGDIDYMRELWRDRAQEKLRFPASVESRRILNLWHAGFDTLAISIMLGMSEGDIYNVLVARPARVK
jgi:hypothetical protein